MQEQAPIHDAGSGRSGLGRCSRSDVVRRSTTAPIPRSRSARSPESLRVCGDSLRKSRPGSVVAPDSVGSPPRSRRLTSPSTVSVLDCWETTSSPYQRAG